MIFLQKSVKEKSAFYSFMFDYGIKVYYRIASEFLAYNYGKCRLLKEYLCVCVCVSLLYIVFACKILKYSQVLKKCFKL